MDLITRAEYYLNNLYYYVFPEPVVQEETWEDHPVIKQFYKIKDFKNLTQVQRECIAIAYALHDRHFKISFENLIKTHSISADAVKEAKTRQEIEFLKSKVEELVRSGSVCGDYCESSENLNTTFSINMEGFTYDDWWSKYEKLTEDLRKQVESGKVHNIETFYHYMCVEPGLQLDEVLSQGW